MNRLTADKETKLTETYIPSRNPNHEARKLFDEFDPFPHERKRFEKIEPWLAALGVVLALAVVGGIATGKEVWMIVIVAAAAIYGLVYVVLIFRRVAYNQRKLARFTERHPHLVQLL